MANHDDDRIGIDFIDPLFAVALHLNFVELQREEWFNNFPLLLRPPYTFTFVTLILCYATVILSWVGYHRSIKSNPIKVKTLAGWWRFILDVLLLFVYFVLLVSYHNFMRELKLLGFVFFLFVLWDIAKKAEHPASSYPDDDARNRAVAQRGVTVFWFILFAVGATFYTLRPPQVRYECEDWLMLFGALAGTVLYRVHKIKLWWPKSLTMLGYYI